jgi:hypothetical protein
VVAEEQFLAIAELWLEFALEVEDKINQFAKLETHIIRPKQREEDGPELEVLL